MVQYSSRLGLPIPSYSDSADVSVISSAIAAMEAGTGRIVCTEASKPAAGLSTVTINGNSYAVNNLFNGLQIVCTDSGNRYYYSGGTFAGTPPVCSGGSWNLEYLQNITTTINAGASVFRGSNASGSINSGSANPADMGFSTSINMASSYAMLLELEGSIWGVDPAGNLTAPVGSYTPNSVAVSLYMDGTLQGTMLTITANLDDTGGATKLSGSNEGSSRLLGKYCLNSVSSGAHTFTAKITTSGGSFSSTATVNWQGSLICTVSG